MTTTTTTPTQYEQRKRGEAMLAAMRSDPAAFRAALVIDADAGPVRLGDTLDDWQAADFLAMDLAWRHVAHRTGELRHRRAWLERPRGHAKTSDLAAMIAWVLFASPRRLSGLAAAADKDQAKLLRDAVSKLVAQNPWLSKFLDVQAYRIVNPHTDSTLEIISSDAPSSYGATPDFIVADEVTHWRDRELFDSLLSSAAKRSHCLLLVICNAGFADSWQWKLREAVRCDAAWYFHSLNGPCASWITPAVLDEQRRLLPHIAYERLWLNRWGSGSGDAIDPADLDAAIVTATAAPARRITHPHREYVYMLGVDLGLKHDATALVAVGRHVGYTETIARPTPAGPANRTIRAMVELGYLEPAVSEETEYRHHPATGRYAVASVQLWKPERGQTVSLSDVEAAIRRAHELYRFASIAIDPWQAALLVERLRAAGLPVVPIDFSAGNLKAMATTVLEAFVSRTIDLPEHSQLLHDLRGLRVIEKSYGIRLDSPRGPDGHGDAATAMALGLLAASRVTAAARPATVDGPLICWP